MVEAFIDWFRNGSREELAWYDMAIGNRAYRLSYVIAAAARSDAIRDKDFKSLIEMAVRHARELAKEEDFAAHSNHGLFQAAGLQALTRRLGKSIPVIGELSELAQERLLEMLLTQFGDDGMHLEHSPGYHFAVLGTLVSLTRTGIIGDERLGQLREKAERAMAWVTLPNGVVAPLGDTPHRVLAPEDPTEDELRAATRAFRSPELLHVATRGLDGSAPDENLIAFPTSGYVVARTWEPDGSGTSLIFTAGFHSQVHKHADDLSFVWYDSGRLILSDGGQYGYERGNDADRRRTGRWYADPKRIYVESTRAHNTVVIDDSDHDRSRDPHGSALTGWGETDGVYFASGEVGHGTVTHSRTLAMTPGVWLAVIDRLRDGGGDSKPQPHTYLQSFLAAPDLDLSSGPDGTVLQPRDGGSPIHITSLSSGPKPAPAIRGAEEPRLAGWVSTRARELEPAWTFGFEEAGESAEFATIFSLAGPVDGEAEGDAVAFEAGAERVRLTVGDDGSLLVERTQAASL